MPFFISSLEIKSILLWKMHFLLLHEQQQRHRERQQKKNGLFCKLLVYGVFCVCSVSAEFWCCVVFHLENLNFSGFFHHFLVFLFRFYFIFIGLCNFAWYEGFIMWIRITRFDIQNPVSLWFFLSEPWSRFCFILNVKFLVLNLWHFPYRSALCWWRQMIYLAEMIVFWTLRVEVK